jgi:hypothetical protein
LFRFATGAAEEMYSFEKKKQIFFDLHEIQDTTFFYSLNMSLTVAKEK